MKYKVLAFDLIGVLYGRGHVNHEFTLPFLGLGLKDYPKVSRLYIKYKKGQVTKDEFWGAFGRSSTVEGKFLQKVKKSFNRDFLKLVKALDKKYELTAVTDLPAAWAVYLLNINNDFTFDYEVISAVTGKKKDESISNFKELLKKMKVKGGQVLFIDDKLKNLKSAAKLGIKTVWFKREGSKIRFQPDYVIKRLDDLLKIIK